jgi:hypothetical protein
VTVNFSCAATTEVVLTYTVFGSAKDRDDHKQTGASARWRVFL